LVALLYRIIAILNIFPVIYVMTKGGPGRFTEVLNYYAFTHGFQFLDIGYASALAMGLFVLIVALSGLFMLLRMRFTGAE
jgi:ABC-type sugar transport system permease subunit